MIGLTEIEETLLMGDEERNTPADVRHGVRMIVNYWQGTRRAYRHTAPSNLLSKDRS